MIRAVVKTVCLFAGLLWLVALADKWGWLSPVWASILPEVVLPRALTIREVQMAQLEQKVEATRAEIETLRGAKSDSRQKRRALLNELRERLGHSVDPFDDAKPVAQSEAKPNTERDPVVQALVWSVDAEDRRGTMIEAKLKRSQADVDHLQSRLVALKNGVSLIELNTLTRPTERLPSQDETERSVDRFNQIVREATESTN